MGWIASWLFAKKIGDTNDLDKSCQNIFKKDQRIIEAEWQQYLSKVPISITQPRIIKMFPENGATQVSNKTTEIYVEFNVSMGKRISIYSDGNGISYKNAYWKTDKILAIKVDLIPNHYYHISLGSTSGNKLLSKDYDELLPTPWSFITGSE